MAKMPNFEDLSLESKMATAKMETLNAPITGKIRGIALWFIVEAENGS